MACSATRRNCFALFTVFRDLRLPAVRSTILLAGASRTWEFSTINATFSRGAIPKSLRTSTGIVTCPLLVTVFTNSFISYPIEKVILQARRIVKEKKEEALGLATGILIGNASVTRALSTLRLSWSVFRLVSCRVSELPPLTEPEREARGGGLWLCAPDNTGAGHIIQAGVGYYAKIEVREAAGVLFDTETIPQPEQIRDRYTEITDMDGAAPYENASAVIRKVFKMVRPKG